MKELLDAFLTRIKSPFLGLTFLLYFTVNLKTILIFCVVDNKDKLDMINNYQIDFGVLSLCALLSIAYVISSDWLQYILDQCVYKAKEKRQSIVYQSRANLANAEYKSTSAYQAKIIEKELEDWLSQKNKYESELKDVSEILNSSNEIKNESKKLKKEIVQLIDMYHDMGNQVDDLKLDVMSILSNIGYTLDKSGNVSLDNSKITLDAPKILRN
ncbi:hypothetical protein K0L52_003986, partial [Vibrio fluvialis]|nr:hypothetical protein [Vibrio fluvialis]